MLKKNLLFLLLMVTQIGCSTLKNINQYFSSEANTEPPASLNAILPKINVTKIWSKNIGKGTKKQYLKLTPTIYEDSIYVTSHDGYLLKLDATTGQDIWSKDTDEPITSGPGAGEDFILFGTQKADIYAYSASNGRFLWKTRSTSEVLAAPQIKDSVVVVHTIDGRLFGLNAATGGQLWNYDHGVPPLTLRGISIPIIEGNSIVVGFDDGKLANLELNSGRLLWETLISQPFGNSELDRMVDIDSAVVIKDDIIYVSAFQGSTAAVELETGRTRWKRDIPSHAGLATDNQYVYVTDDDGYIWSLEKLSGSPNWKQEQLKARRLTAPTHIGNYIVVGDLEGYLHWLDGNTGEVVARYQFSNKPIISPPIANRNILYAISSDGTLAAFTYQ